MDSLNFTERIVTDFATDSQNDGISSGFVGTVFCWIVGIAICISAVAFSLYGGFLTKACGLLILLFGAMVCGCARTASARWKLRFAAVFMSSCFLLLLTEGGMRLMTDYPVDLQCDVIGNSELGHVLDPTSPGVDSNGFRNASVPETADIVTIGDSQTQGINVLPIDAWPSQLATQLGQVVYNMGVQGYGPLQYDKLVDEALKLRPKHVVIGLNLADDLSDAAEGISERHSTNAADNSLRHHLRFHTALGSISSELLKNSPLGRPAGFGINHPANPAYFANQRIENLARQLNTADPKIVTALNSTIAMLAAARQRCQQQRAGLTVLIIPTREAVYFANRENRDPELPGPLSQIAQAESSVRDHLKNSLSNQQISFVDILPAMAAALDAKTDVYASHNESHPESGGYATYAAAVSQHLSRSSTATN